MQLTSNYERNILGWAMVSDSPERYLDQIGEGDFVEPVHAKIFDSIIDCISHGITPDAVNVSSSLQKFGVLDQVGGRSYVNELMTSCEARAWNIDQLVKDFLRQGKYINTSRAVRAATAQLAENYDIDDVIRQLQNQIDLLTSNRKEIQEMSYFQCLNKAWEKSKSDHEKNKKPFTPSGLLELDDIIGGFRPGELVTLGGRPAMGKSATAWHFAMASAQQGPTLLCSYEMPLYQWGYRGIANLAGVSYRKIEEYKDLSYPERQNIEKALANAGNLPMYLANTLGYDVNQLSNLIRRYHKEHGGLSAVYIDHLRLIKKTSGGSDIRAYQIEEITATLKQLAIELDCPIILLCQLNRDCEKRQNKRPVLSDLKDSGAIEEDSAVVIFLYREEYYDPDTPKRGELELIVAKNRSGALGTAECLFRGSTVQILGKAS